MGPSGPCYVLASSALRACLPFPCLIPLLLFLSKVDSASCEAAKYACPLKSVSTRHCALPSLASCAISVRILLLTPCGYPATVYAVFLHTYRPEPMPASVVPSLGVTGLILDSPKFAWWLAAPAALAGFSMPALPRLPLPLLLGFIRYTLVS